MTNKTELFTSGFAPVGGTKFDPNSAWPARRARTGEGTLEVIAVATGFLFRFRLVRIGVTMFSTRIRVVAGIEAVSFGAMLAVRSAILPCRVGLHVDLSVRPGDFLHRIS